MGNPKYAQILRATFGQEIDFNLFNFYKYQQIWNVAWTPKIFIF